MTELLNTMRNAVGHFHPALVHFPIALLLTGAALETWQVVRRTGVRSDAGRLLLYAGLLGAVAAAVSGLLLFHPGDFRGRTLEAAYVHRVLGIATALGALATAVVGAMGRPGGTGATRLRLYRFLYGMSALLAGLAGHYGGWIVFGWGRVWTF